MRLFMVFSLLLPLAGCGVELLTTTAIQGELAAQSAKQGMKQLDNAKAMKSDIEVGSAIRAYQAEHGNFPPSLEALVPDYLAVVPVGYGYNPATGEFGEGIAGAVSASASLSNAIPPSDVQAMMKIKDAINAFGGATGFYPSTLENLVPDYLPEVPMTSQGEPFIYSNTDGDLIHPSRVGAPVHNYAEGGAGAGTEVGVNTGGDPFKGTSMERKIDARQERNAAQYGGISPTLGGGAGPTGAVPNPKSTMDRVKGSLNNSLSGRSQ